MTERFDAVVVGAGSAGAIVAARLSEDEGRSVLLLEAGRDFPDEAHSPPAFFVGGNAFGEMFAGIGASTPEHDWGFWSEPLASGRRIHLRRGRLVGGSSMVNGCIAVRAKPSDFERWVELGAEGWGWDDVRPFFELVEREIPIRRYDEEVWHPFDRLYLAAAKETGFREVEDLNAAASWNGVVGAWPSNRRNEVRQGTLVTYVRKARPRPNFEVRGHALVDRVLVSGDRATGVRYVEEGGRAVEVGAGLVVLSAGAYSTPPILLRSGIGPAAELRRLGVEPVADLPGVGRNLMEHPQCLFLVRTPPALARMAGPFLTVAARGDDFFSFPMAMDEEEGMCAVSLALAWEEGIGTVSIASIDPAAAPVIDHRYQQVIDRGLFENAFAWFRELVETEAFRTAGARAADDRPLREILDERLGTAFHPAGTCAIGSVVDPDLRVYGIGSLVVADASVFPAHVTNNLNLTCLMVGERAAALVAGRRETEVEAAA